MSLSNVTIPLSARSHFLQKLSSSHAQNILYIANQEDEAAQYYNEVKFFNPSIDVKYLQAWDTVPYDKASPHSDIMSSRCKILCDLALSNKPALIITSAKAVLQKIPPASYLVSSMLDIYTGMKETSENLSKFLVSNGFVRTAAAVDFGDFAVKGCILDIVTEKAQGYRIEFAWDRIESIRIFDTQSQISFQKIDRFKLYPASEVMLSEENVARFRSAFLKSFGVNHANSPLYEAVAAMRKFPAVEYLMPLFFDECVNILDYIKSPIILTDYLFKAALAEETETINSFFNARTESNRTKSSMFSFYFTLPPKLLWLTGEELYKSTDFTELQIGEGESYQSVPNFNLESQMEGFYALDLLKSFLNNHNDKRIYFCCTSNAAVERMSHILESYEYKTNKIEKIEEASDGLINIIAFNLKAGFIADNQIFLTEQDLFGKKIKVTQGARKQFQSIVSEMDNFAENDFVIHQDHGIGQFLGVETLEIENRKHDCIKLLYADSDKLYIPVENIDVLKKYGSEEAKLDKLGASSWQQRKARTKGRIRDIAEKLMKIAASRKLIDCEPTEINLSSYEQFCNKFEFTETEDQLNAIADIEEDLKSGHPFDRLICGDAGFGKTEVAMRASFLVTSNSNRKQVAVIVPTTILCRQHYINFIERFVGFDLNIRQLSRLTTNAEISRIKHGLADGSVDIVVGTSALLGKDIKFHNLGMLVVDEEQHFGVAQKERIKELRHGVHILSMSATPIPRTLQMALLGIKSMSLIATPPVDRLDVRTSILQFDPVIIKDALEREQQRGGRSFYVAPRIKDLGNIEEFLRQYLPNQKYVIAHGGMAPSIIDKAMQEFYEGKFDILLSTTIVASGIDIPPANTIIIHHAEMLGLSELYQLRGRVGRGKTRGHAYLTLHPQKMPTKNALKRLEVMQTLDSLGAGFSIASSDMDIRGFGNLVGEEQAGHVREVGVELYQEMLQDAVLKLANQALEEDKFSPNINLGLSISIPEEYVNDSTLRIGLYKRIANFSTEEELMDFENELIDRFGPIPPDARNLLKTIQIKNLCKALNIEKFDSGPKGFLLKFRNCPVEVEQKIMRYIAAYPRHTKLKANNQMVVIQDTSREHIINESIALLCNLGGM